MIETKLTEKETEFLIKQKKGVKNLFIGFAIFCSICCIIFLGSYFNSSNCIKRIWGYRALLFFILTLCSIGTLQIINKYLKIINKLIK